MDPITINPVGVSQAAMQQAEKAKLAVEAAEAEKQARLAKDVKVIKEKREFYMNVNGGFYVFPDGTVARFTNGVYATDSAYEIDELEKLLKLSGQHLITNEPQEVLTTDMRLLKEVSQSTKGTPIQGAVGTNNIFPK